MMGPVLMKMRNMNPQPVACVVAESREKCNELYTTRLLLSREPHTLLALHRASRRTFFALLESHSSYDAPSSTGSLPSTCSPNESANARQPEPAG